MFAARDCYRKLVVCGKKECSNPRQVSELGSARRNVAGKEAPEAGLKGLAALESSRVPRSNAALFS